MKAPSLVVLLLVTLAAPQAARASETVAIMPLEHAPEHAELVETIDQALRQAVASLQNMSDKGPVAMGLDEARLSFACFDESPGCMAQVAGLLEADHLVWGKIARDEGALILSLRMLDTRTREIKNKDYRQAGPQAPERLKDDAIEFLTGRRPEQAARLAISSDPSGAQLFVDGEIEGQTPATIDLMSGPHTVELRLAGMQDWRRQLEVKPGDDTLDVRLLPKAPVGARVDDAAKPEDEQPARTGMWLGVGFGALAVAAGGVGIAYGVKTLDIADEQKATDSQIRAKELEDDGKSARLVTNISWGVAAAAAATGAYFLFFYDDGDPGVAVAPTTEGVLLRARF